MKLATYISERGVAASLAVSLGVSASTITRLASGARKPSLALALKIAAATGGKVRPEDFATDDAARAPERVTGGLS